MEYITAILYIMGSYLYHLHQQTVLYFVKERDYDERKVLFNSLIWPIRVIEIMIAFVVAKPDDEDDDGDDQEEQPKQTNRKR